MQAFFNRLFSRTPSQEAGPSVHSSQGFYSSMQAGSEQATRAQIIHIVMRDLVNESGIPPGWIVCQPQVINSRSRGQGIFVRLSVKHWDDRLMHYAFAFQKALLTGIVRFEPKASTWLHGIAWQLEVASTCPHTMLPNKDFWLEAPAPATMASLPVVRSKLVLPLSPMMPTIPMAPITPAPNVAFDKTVTMPAPKQSAQEVEAIEDLERFFAVRDKELAVHDSAHLLPAGYENTEAAPLTSR